MDRYLVYAFPLQPTSYFARGSEEKWPWPPGSSGVRILAARVRGKVLLGVIAYVRLWRTSIAY